MRTSFPNESTSNDPSSSPDYSHSSSSDSSSSDDDEPARAAPRAARRGRAGFSTSSSARARAAAVSHLPPPTYDDDDEIGCLAYFFRGDQDPSEISVFRKICMKFGLTAWDEMERRLPWRTRSAFRTTLCRILRKQSLAEYAGIRADPFEIQRDNPLNFSLTDEEYTVKGGILVNQKWDRSPAEIESVRQENLRKYGLGDDEAAAIDIPVIISIDYLGQLAENRRHSLILKVAAMKAEFARRIGNQAPDLGLQGLKLVPAEAVDLPPPGEALRTEFDTHEVYFDIPKPATKGN